MRKSKDGKIFVAIFIETIYNIFVDKKKCETRMKHFPIPYSILKPTVDQWYPSFKMDDGKMYVQVTFTKTGPNPPINGLWRVCVWGEDDFGMEKDFEKKTDAQKVFKELIKVTIITIQDLEQRGFRVA